MCGSFWALGWILYSATPSSPPPSWSSSSSSPSDLYHSLRLFFLHPPPHPHTNTHSVTHSLAFSAFLSSVSGISTAENTTPKENKKATSPPPFIRKPCRISRSHFALRLCTHNTLCTVRRSVSSPVKGSFTLSLLLALSSCAYQTNIKYLKDLPAWIFWQPNVHCPPWLNQIT